ncbi:cytochrome P450 [Chiua virens]|nr:cytochrome P450 [Chiua virens]
MSIILLGFTAVLLSIEGVRRFRQHEKLPLPPGPTPIPFLGNVLGVNPGEPYLTYMEWSKTYGDLICIRALGKKVVILNSEELAVALLDKRSKKYSDRPQFSAAQLFDFDWGTSVARYGPRFRLHRRLLHRAFRAKQALTYRPRQLKSAYEMMESLLDNPLDYPEHFTTFAAAIVMAVTYGHDMKGGETFVSAMYRATYLVVRYCTPQITALYAAFPFVASLPAWFPGMIFLSKAAECRSLAVDRLHAPYAWVKRRMGEGNAPPSMVADAIARYQLYDDSKDPDLVQAIKDSAGSLYAASMVTTRSALLTFVYVMMNHPEVQRRAQADIDRVVGRKRLPSFDDREALPYVDAVLRETMRWSPMSPMGTPHATSEDDIYNGCYIPQGPQISSVAYDEQSYFRAISRNEKKYPNPEAFIPERFIREDGTLNEDTIPWIFGFGRRICPGRYVGDASVWSAMNRKDGGV